MSKGGVENDSDTTQAPEGSALAFLNELDEAQREAAEKEILHALFDQEDGDNSAIDAAIEQMKPTDAFWECVEYDPETGKVSLTIDPFDDSKDSRNIDGPWRFLNSLFPKSNQNDVTIRGFAKAVNADRFDWKWGTPVTFEGSTADSPAETSEEAPVETAESPEEVPATEGADETPAAEGADQEPEATNGAETPEGQNDTVSEEAQPVAGEVPFKAEGNDEIATITIGEGNNAAVYENAHFVENTSEYLAYEVRNSDGSYTYIKQNKQDGTVIVNEYSSEEVYNANSNSAQKTTKFNSDGSKVETATEKDENGTVTTITKNTSATGDYVSITKDSKGKLTKVNINGQDNDLTGFGYDAENDYYYKTNEKGEIVDFIQILDDGTIEKGYSDGQNFSMRIYNQFGELQTLSVGNQEYDVSNHTKDGNTYTSIKTSNASKTETITLNEDGSVVITEKNNDTTTTLSYDKNGMLTQASSTNGQNTTSANYKNGELKSVMINGANYEVNTFQGKEVISINGENMAVNIESNGTVTIEGYEAPEKTVPLKIEDNKITIGEGSNAVEFPNAQKVGENEYEVTSTSEDGTITSYTRIIINDDGTVVANEYSNKDVYDAEGKAQKTIEFNNDGSKVETVKNDDGTTTIKNTSATGDYGVEVTEDKYGNLLKVKINNVEYDLTKNHSYDNEKNCYYAVRENGQRVELALTPDGFVETIYSKDGETCTSRTYDSFGELQKANINGVEYDLTQYEKNGSTYTKYDTSDNSKTEQISFDLYTTTIKQEDKTSGNSSSIAYSQDGGVMGVIINNRIFDRIEQNEDGTYKATTYNNGEYVDVTIKIVDGIPTVISDIDLEDIPQEEEGGVRNDYPEQTYSYSEPITYDSLHAIFMTHDENTDDKTIKASQDMYFKIAGDNEIQAKIEAGELTLADVADFIQDKASGSKETLILTMLLEKAASQNETLQSNDPLDKATYGLNNDYTPPVSTATYDLNARCSSMMGIFDAIEDGTISNPNEALYLLNVISDGDTGKLMEIFRDMHSRETFFARYEDRFIKTLFNLYTKGTFD